jgi:hypothetical protein
MLPTVPISVSSTSANYMDHAGYFMMMSYIKIVVILVTLSFMAVTGCLPTIRQVSKAQLSLKQVQQCLHHL